MFENPDEAFDDADFEDDFFDMLGHNTDFDMSAYWNEPDFLLADIVNAFVNMSELEIGVTLFVKGRTITGTLVSEKQYLRDLSKTFRNRVQVKKTGKTTKKDRAELNQMFDFTELSESNVAEQLDEFGMHRNKEFPAIRFLHMKNPVMVEVNGIVDFGQMPSTYIRVRLTQIDGWMLGQAANVDMFKDDGNTEILH
jgi:Fe2+ transport system protein FeoA